MKKLPLVIFSLLLCLCSRAEDSWQHALAQMPLKTNVTVLNRANWVKIMLPSFQSNDLVKALIFMPGATDEFNMFHRARATLTNANPTLLDAITALTNQTYIRATFRRPLLLLHTDEDPLDPIVVVNDFRTASRLEARPFMPCANFYDRDWDYLQPLLTRKLHAFFSPRRYSAESFHFYRHSLVAWNLNGWEALEAIALAGKTTITIEHNHVIFAGDTRMPNPPRTDHIGQYPD